mgnify:FL=1|jgi:hypothetical protein
MSINEDYLVVMRKLTQTTESVMRLTKLLAQHEKDYAHQKSRRHEAEEELQKLKAKYATSEDVSNVK